MSTQIPEEKPDAEAAEHPPPPPEEEEGECGFCLFMKGGGCRDAFVSFENYCRQEADNNKEKCAQVAAALTKCMYAHADYYEPIFRVEKAALAKLENEKQQHQENVPPPSRHFSDVSYATQLQ